MAALAGAASLLSMEAFKMRIARVSKENNEVINVEEWTELPAATDEHLFVAGDIGGMGWTYSGGVLLPPVTEALSFDDVKEANRAAIIAKYNEQIQNGFSLGNGDSLQMRKTDQANWLILKDICQDAIDAGAGGHACPTPPRTVLNKYWQGTHAEVKALLIQARTWGIKTMFTKFAKLDANEAAVTQQNLDAIDVAAGWP